jgi:hypothetical protein
MSGGHFGYKQYEIGCIADAIELLIETNDDTTLDEWGNPRGRGYPPDVIELFRAAVPVLRRAQVYAQRIDWLVSGDDGEDSFVTRLRADLEKLA